MNDNEKIENIINIVTQERFSHTYLIGRREAKEDLELNVIDISEEMEDKIVSLFQECDNLIHMGVPYNAELVLGELETAIGQFDRCVVESKDLTHFYRTRKEVQRHRVIREGLPQLGYLERLLIESWVEDNSL